jgi:hypothetical protein
MSLEQYGKMLNYGIIVIALMGILALGAVGIHNRAYDLGVLHTTARYERALAEYRDRMSESETRYLEEITSLQRRTNQLRRDSREDSSASRESLSASGSMRLNSILSSPD